MAEQSLKERSLYAGAAMVLTTRHAKSVAIGPAFWAKLGASVLEYVVDTDAFGTFSGEIERNGSALDCARQKCKLAIDHVGPEVEFALASEGSFGPHPIFPFVAGDVEILYFIDRRHRFELNMSHVSEKTNFQAASVSSMKELLDFAERALFPSHALILRANDRGSHTTPFKGLDTHEKLERAFSEAKKQSTHGTVWVETDMRAQFNPTRMGVIGELADKFAARLSQHCPRCGTPGWGRRRTTPGLMCWSCGAKTELVKEEVYGCQSCDYEETFGRPDGKLYAEPMNCMLCNP